ncbi:hypothetical protein ISN45_Aa02g026210 [Arabidopsis thaliana x Arabidopsis arenosa]|uniref:Uncharacterized protein n=1 Tax=Arabidopsis thaliana x Arabidopsis arenosa TaxID=1240361 RepID=A0A8T2BNR5_9BRAS|nr:hypothetical protein ISN45_Aa02g026210 [Arabidopsis thaliana x Arabidopsis arenosa]
MVDDLCFFFFFLSSAFPAEKMLQLMAEHCRSMKRFVYIDERVTGKRRIAKHSTLLEFVNNCGQIESLTLGGIKIADSDLALILQVICLILIVTFRYKILFIFSDFAELYTSYHSRSKWIYWFHRLFPIQCRCSSTTCHSSTPRMHKYLPAWS